MNYEAVIGIEIHCELKTVTKMFSGAPLVYGATPNTAINEIDLGYPGTLPQINKQAVSYGVSLAHALECVVDPVLRFDRKNYFYSDLPKGYQITQQVFPLGRDGTFDIYVKDEKKTVRINRIHLEEDTAKQFHDEDKTLIDFNRAGTPLVEIVTEADFRSGEEAAAYVDAIRLLVVYLGISDGKMAEGSLRCDVNISIRPEGTKPFGTKVEIKNLNSISNVQKSIEFEKERQAAVLSEGNLVVEETRRFDERTQTTVSMRSKESAVDYRYFTEPNIPPTQIPEYILNQERLETPIMRIDRFQREYNLSFYDANVLVKQKEVSDYFEAIVKEISDVKLVANWMTQDVLSVLDQKGDQSLHEFIKPAYFVEFLQAIMSKEISSRQAKEVFVEMVDGKNPKKVIKDKGMVLVSDEATLTAWIEEVIANNPRAVLDHKNGLPSGVKFVTGQVMRLSKGQANPQFTNMLVKKLLDKQ